MFEIITVKDKDYKLRLTARNCVELEKRLGTNPINILVKAQDGTVPSIEVLIAILHASLQAYNSGISLDDAYALYDDYVDEGHTLTDILPTIINIFKVSGFFKDEDPKNAEHRVAKK